LISTPERSSNLFPASARVKTEVGAILLSSQGVLPSVCRCSNPWQLKPAFPASCRQLQTQEEQALEPASFHLSLGGRQAGAGSSVSALVFWAYG
jgi:hypothetical protein